MDCHITIAGNVGTTIDHRSGEGANGKWSRSEFRLGCTRRVRGGDGVWGDAGTTWVTVLCWGRLADSVRVCVDRGQPVIVVGRLTTDEWTDQNGEVRSRLLLTADRIGHDLSRGVAGFSRGSALVEAPHVSPAAWEALADSSSTSASPGQRTPDDPWAASQPDGDPFDQQDERAGEGAFDPDVAEGEAVSSGAGVLDEAAAKEDVFA